MQVSFMTSFIDSWWNVVSIFKLKQWILLLDMGCRFAGLMAENFLLQWLKAPWGPKICVNLLKRTPKNILSLRQ